MRLLLLLLFLLLPGGAAANGLSLTPEVIPDGGVALLRWQGSEFSSGTVKFNGRLLQMTATDDGGLAMLGADLGLAAGDYPLLVTVVDRRGMSFFQRLSLEVRQGDYAEERLSLPPAMVSPQDPKILQRIRDEHRVLKNLFARQDGPLMAEGFVLPVNDALGSRFGLRRILNGKPRSPHAGVDFRSPRGTRIKAPGKGRVVFSGDLYFTGNTVILDHGSGCFTLYAHLEQLLSSAGDPLEQGQVLGTVGSSGRSTGPHLHWGVKLRGDRIDPMALLEVFGSEKP